MVALLPLVVLWSPVVPTVEASVPTNGQQIRQFAFDGDPATHFASAAAAKKDDTFTLAFDRPVLLKAFAVATGNATGEDALAAGVLEVSADGKTFEAAATFANGAAKMAGGKAAKAVRVRVTEDQEAALVVREIKVESVPAVAAFRHPVEFVLDVADAPEMRPWAEKVVRVCERQYPMICDELASDGYRPPTLIRMAFKADFNGVAEAAGNRIRGSVKYFKDRPNDVGAMVHETAHCVQNYRKRGLPGWLVEGIADYVRFWKYEPGKAGRLSPERARYDASYRTTAAFLAFVSEKYDRKAVTKLNALLREGKYDPEVWKEIAGKSVEELNQEWRRSLVK
jgi:hypothetical protein